MLVIWGGSEGVELPHWTPATTLRIVQRGAKLQLVSQKWSISVNQNIFKKLLDLINNNQNIDQKQRGPFQAFIYFFDYGLQVIKTKDYVNQKI